MSVEDDTSGKERSVSANAKNAADSLQDLARSVAAKTKDAADETVHKARTLSDVPAVVDAKDISHLGPSTGRLMSQFEQAILEISKESPADQALLFDSYKKFLQGQIDVITARMVMAGRLKPGS